MSRIRNPKDKKIRSYESDCRNIVAESGSSARKGIAKHKACASQALRKAVHDQLVTAGRGVESLEEFQVTVDRVGRKSFRKFPDSPLAESIQRKIDNPKRFQSTIAAESRNLAKAQGALAKKRG
jgi:hypothetical protein